MKAYMYPRYQKEAAKPGWIVKLLYFLGLLQVVGCAILGATVGGPIISLLLSALGVRSQTAVSGSSGLLGLIVGIIVGVLSGLVYFALSQVIDDLHALRVQSAAYVAVTVDDEKED